jgi:hypothetical protein
METNNATEPRPHCEVLNDKDSFSLVIQGLLGVMGFCALLVKRQIEHPPRQFNIWALDVGKQACSQVCAHFFGIFASVVLDYKSRHLDSGDHCSWYAIVFTLNTTFGTLSTYYLVVLVTYMAVAGTPGMGALKHSGEYGDPVSMWVYGVQLFVWIGITVLGRAVVLLVMLTAIAPLAAISEALAMPFIDHPRLFLTLVMIGCPLCMNIVQMWIQDSFLKSNKEDWTEVVDGPEEAASAQETGARVFSNPLAGNEADETPRRSRKKLASPLQLSLSSDTENPSGKSLKKLRLSRKMTSPLQASLSTEIEDMSGSPVTLELSRTARSFDRESGSKSPSASGD